MKNLLISLVCLVILITGCCGGRSAAAVPDSSWSGDKYSMFIHFGLYSMLGGVWQGENVLRGYSEQIQSHAGIHADVYEALASGFDPVRFDADSIAALARRAGMRSIILTSKHHDGFCLWGTSTTRFNSRDASPCGRDFVAEMSEACKRAGLKFGLYFSLIDWNLAGGSNITSHNANFITPQHHAFNLAQVGELVTRYGTISELWFDMGSLTPEQSRELYSLVHAHQPSCMVSGRLGNGCYDFAVMSDNFYPESSLQTPWQSAASMFDETWGYRSWQERGDAHAKALEKLRSLLRVVSGGGNFLLNIGPEGDGSVVPFEAEVLGSIGKWLSQNGGAVYGTGPSPFRTPFDWGCVTVKGPALNLILSGECPDDAEVVLPPLRGNLLSISGPATAISTPEGVIVTFDDDIRWGDMPEVVTLLFDRSVEASPSSDGPGRTETCSYFCQDYYTNARSVVSYSWPLPCSGEKSARLTYTASEAGKTVDVNIAGEVRAVKLAKDVASTLDASAVREISRHVCRTRKADFDSPTQIRFSLDRSPDWRFLMPWKEWDKAVAELDAAPFNTVFHMLEVEASRDCDILVDIVAGNGAELYVNGSSVMKHLNPYRCTSHAEKVRVSLHAGADTLVLRSYNRFERKVPCSLAISEDQTLYGISIPLNVNEKGGETCTSSINDGGMDCCNLSKRLTISGHSPDSPHQDCLLHNLRIE